MHDLISRGISFYCAIANCFNFLAETGGGSAALRYRPVYRRGLVSGSGKVGVPSNINATNTDVRGADILEHVAYAQTS